VSLPTIATSILLALNSLASWAEDLRADKPCRIRESKSLEEKL